MSTEPAPSAIEIPQAKMSARPKKPRLGETAADLWIAIKSASGGVMCSEAGGRILYPTLRVVGSDDFQLASDGALRVVVRETDGMAVRDATEAEAAEFHRDLDGDRVQVLLLTPPGYGSNYTSQRIVREMHSPSGLSFELPPRLTPAQPAVQAHDSNDLAPSPYSLRRVAKELELTAMGEAYFGNALRVAKDVSGVDAEERALLDRYATGSQRGTDHVALQQLAIKLRDINP